MLGNRGQSILERHNAHLFLETKQVTKPGLYAMKVVYCFIQIIVSYLFQNERFSSNWIN